MLFLVSSVRNFQACLGLQKLLDLPLATEDGELRAPGYKCEGWRYHFQPDLENYSLEEQSGVRRVREMLAGKCARDFSARCRAAGPASKFECGAGRQAK